MCSLCSVKPTAQRAPWGSRWKRLNTRPLGSDLEPDPNETFWSLTLFIAFRWYHLSGPSSLAEGQLSRHRRKRSRARLFPCENEGAHCEFTAFGKTFYVFFK